MLWITILRNAWCLYYYTTQSRVLPITTLNYTMHCIVYYYTIISYGRQPTSTFQFKQQIFTKSFD